MPDGFQLPPAPPPPAHEPPDMMALFGIMRALGPKSAGGPLTPEDLAEVAKDAGQRVAMAYAAAGMNPSVEFARSHDVVFMVCTGRCQMWGAYDLIELLLERQAARLAQGKKSFDVISRGCLDQCEKPSAILVFSPDGTAALLFATAERIDEAIAALCDD